MPRKKHFISSKIHTLRSHRLAIMNFMGEGEWGSGERGAREGLKERKKMAKCS